MQRDEMRRLGFTGLSRRVAAFLENAANSPVAALAASRSVPASNAARICINRATALMRTLRSVLTRRLSTSCASPEPLGRYRIDRAWSTSGLPNPRDPDRSSLLTLRSELTIARPLSCRRARLRDEHENRPSSSITPATAGFAGEGQLADIASAIDGSLVARTGTGGLDFAAMLDHARSSRRPRALRKMTFHERARMIKGLGLAIMARKEELYALNFAHRRDAQGRLDRHRGRRGHPSLLLVEGPPRTARRACPARRPGRAAVEERQLHRPAYLHPAAGRGGAHQRLQFPGLGDARKARPDPARGDARDRQAGQLDRLPVRSRVPDHDRHRPAARPARCS